jgi:hypothetical protein
VAGSGITFAERGSHALNGPRDEWPLFAVTGFGMSDLAPAARRARAAGPGAPV